MDKDCATWLKDYGFIETTSPYGDTWTLRIEEITLYQDEKGVYTSYPKIEIYEKDGMFTANITLVQMERPRDAKIAGESEVWLMGFTDYDIKKAAIKARIALRTLAQEIFQRL